MTVAIINRQRTRKINARLLKKITNALLAKLKITEAELGINLVTTPRMTVVNETFIKHEGSTDVITFDYSGLELQVPNPVPEVHGELFICVDEAILQARHFKTTWQSEVVRYLIHGLLHLLGQDDRTPATRRKMKRQENRLLRRLAKEFPLTPLGR